MKITKHGTVTISMKDGKPDILIENFEIDCEGSGSMDEVCLEALSWALEAMDNKRAEVNDGICRNKGAGT